MGNLGYLPNIIDDYLFSWQTILIVIGTIFIFQPERRGPGTVMLLVGSFFLLREVLDREFDIEIVEWQVLWPIVFIIIGLVILARRAGWLPEEGREGKRALRKGSIDTDDILEVTAILGGGDITVSSQEFRGGEITAIMGGGTYDLSNCRLAPGPQVIDITAIMGGASIIVPSDWKVRMEVTAIFGGFSDSRKTASLGNEDPTQELVIKGTVIFGGGEIKNFV